LVGVVGSLFQDWSRGQSGLAKRAILYRTVGDAVYRAGQWAIQDWSRVQSYIGLANRAVLYRTAWRRGSLM